MHISILHYIILATFVMALGAIGTIFASLDSTAFAALEECFDMSDAILTTVILILMALLPLREKN